MKCCRICSPSRFVLVFCLVFRVDMLGWVARCFSRAVLPKAGRMKETQVAKCNSCKIRIANLARLPKKDVLEDIHCSSKFSDDIKGLSHYYNAIIRKNLSCCCPFLKNKF